MGQLSWVHLTEEARLPLKCTHFYALSHPVGFPVPFPSGWVLNNSHSFQPPTCSNQHLLSSPLSLPSEQC